MDDEDDDEPDRTPVLPDAKRAAMSALGFAELATGLADKLERRGGDRALEMSRRARELAATFGKWSTGLPDDRSYGPAITALVELNQRALELLATPG